jgi:hypothetical protein
MDRPPALRSTLLAIAVAAALTGFSQPDARLDRYFRENIGLSQDEIPQIGYGQPVAKALPSRTPDEVFLFGSIYIHADPSAYVRLMSDVERLRTLPGNLAVGALTEASQVSQLQGFAFDEKDVQALRDCKPGKCDIQLPASGIEQLQRSIDWSRSDLAEQVNQAVRKTVLERLAAYKQQGNEALGVYNDKRDPLEVQHAFAYMLGYDHVLPEVLPEFHRYLLEYPKARPANVEDRFYWSKVKFGLKPTLRVVHMAILKGKPTDPLAYAIAEKQLYASHYFQTALDLHYCVRGTDPKATGFYLVMTLGSEQAGFTGVKGSVVRKAAMGRSVSSLKQALTTIRTTLENNQ